MNFCNKVMIIAFCQTLTMIQWRIEKVKPQIGYIFAMSFKNNNWTFRSQSLISWEYIIDLSGK